MQGWVYLWSPQTKAPAQVAMTAPVTEWRPPSEQASGVSKQRNSISSFPTQLRVSGFRLGGGKELDAQTLNPGPLCPLSHCLPSELPSPLCCGAPGKAPGSMP